MEATPVWGSAVREATGDEVTFAGGSDRSNQILHPSPRSTTSVAGLSGGCYCPSWAVGPKMNNEGSCLSRRISIDASHKSTSPEGAESNVDGSCSVAHRLFPFPAVCWQRRSSHPNSGPLLLFFEGHSCSSSGCASMDLIKSSEVGMELKEGEDLLIKCKRTKFSEFIVQPQQEVEVSDKENNVPDVLLHKVSAAKDPLIRLTDSAVAVQGTGDTNSCIKGDANGTFFTGDESAKSRLAKICSATGWKEPLYDFKEQGPPHNKLFTCKVTVRVEGTADTVLECFGDPKRQKNVAQEHAARGALWWLAHYGRTSI